MIARDAAATKARLLEAATEEFAEYGIAGSRVDRIARKARSNKAQIYHYFGSKDGLFGAVLEAYTRRAVESEYFDATNLPETAATIFDDFEQHPELARLVSWYRLEASQAPMPQMAAANHAKIAAIEQAQSQGLVTDRLPADIILGLILTIATAWTDPPAGFETIERNHSAAQRRAYVAEAVARIVAV